MTRFLRFSRFGSKRCKKKSGWFEVPNPSKDVLRDRMVQLYWHAVSQEVCLLVDTLRSWQKNQYVNVLSENEVIKTEDIFGFKPFLERAVGKVKSEEGCV